eukprot:EG_transcript_2546
MLGVGPIDPDGPAAVAGKVAGKLQQRLAALVRAFAFSAFLKVTFVLVSTLLVKIVLLSWTISGPYWGFVAATFLDFVAYLMLGYRGLVRKEKFSVGAWYLWSVFGTLAVDAAALVISVIYLRNLDIPNKWWNWIPVAHLQHTILSTLVLNWNVYAFFAKKHRVKFVVQDVLEIIDIAQAFYMYVTYLPAGHVDYNPAFVPTYITVATGNYILYWMGSKGLTLPLIIDGDSNQYLTSRQEVKVAAYLEALVLFCDVFTDTPMLVMQAVSKTWALSHIKLAIFCFSIGMLFWAWVRAVLAVGLVTRLLDPRSRWVRRLYGSVITRRKLVKSKVQNCKHPALDMSHDDLGPKLALAVAQGLRYDPVRLTSLDLSVNHLMDEGLRVIAEALKYNTHLRDVNFTDNKIMDEGLSHIANMLEVNRTLVRITLDNNILSDRGALLVEHLLRTSPVLLFCSIEGNGNVHPSLHATIAALNLQFTAAGKPPTGSVPPPLCPQPQELKGDIESHSGAPPTLFGPPVVTAVVHRDGSGEPPPTSSLSFTPHPEPAPPLPSAAHLAPPLSVTMLDVHIAVAAVPSFAADRLELLPEPPEASLGAGPPQRAATVLPPSGPAPTGDSGGEGPDGPAVPALAVGELTAGGRGDTLEWGSAEQTSLADVALSLDGAFRRTRASISGAVATEADQSAVAGRSSRLRVGGGRYGAANFIEDESGSEGEAEEEKVATLQPLPGLSALARLRAAQPAPANSPPPRPFRPRLSRRYSSDEESDEGNEMRTSLKDSDELELGRATARALGDGR